MFMAGECYLYVTESLGIDTYRKMHYLKVPFHTPLSNVDLDKSCEPGEPMTGNHKVDILGTQIHEETNISLGHFDFGS